MPGTQFVLAQLHRRASLRATEAEMVGERQAICYLGAELQPLLRAARPASESR